MASQTLKEQELSTSFISTLSSISLHPCPISCYILCFLSFQTFMWLHPPFPLPPATPIPDTITLEQFILFPVLGLWNLRFVRKHPVLSTLLCFMLKSLPHFSNEYWLQQLFLQQGGSLPFHSCTRQHLGCTPSQCPHPAVNNNTVFSNWHLSRHMRWSVGLWYVLMSFAAL